MYREVHSSKVVFQFCFSIEGYMPNVNHLSYACPAYLSASTCRFEKATSACSSTYRPISPEVKDGCKESTIVLSMSFPLIKNVNVLPRASTVIVLLLPDAVSSMGAGPALMVLHCGPSYRQKTYCPPSFVSTSNT